MQRQVKTHGNRSALALAGIMIIAGLGTLAGPAEATATLVVCASGCPHPDVASALTAAAAGDIIVVRPGVYVGSVAITTPVTLCSTTAAGTACSPTPAATVLEGDSKYVVHVLAPDVTVQGFTIRNPTYTTVDQDGPPVDPSLVVVAAHRASILDNVLAQPAAPPGTGGTRQYTVAVQVASGDDALVARNTMRDFTPGIGPSATCPLAPCEVLGVWNRGGGSGFVVEDNDIRILGTGTPATAVQFTNNAGVVVRDNFLRLPGSPPGSPPIVTGIETTTGATGVLVEGNDIATGLVETPYGLYGVFGVFHGSTFRDNEFRLSQHGLMLRTSAIGGNLVEDNYFFDNHAALLNFAVGTTIRENRFYLGTIAVTLDSVGAGGSVGVVLRENELRNHTRMLFVTESVSGVHVDARENDWGQYTRPLIEARNADDGSGNSVDISCFIDRDGVTRVCPHASFSDTVTNTVWPRNVQLTDTSVSGGRTIDRRMWTLPGGGRSAAPTVDVALLPGSHDVTLQVWDSEGFTDTATRTLVLTNAPPALVLPPTLTATEGTLFSYLLPGTDPDGDTLTYSMADAPAGATLDPDTGLFEWTAPYDADGITTTVTFTASDGLLSTSATTDVGASDTPVPPILDPIPPTAVLEGHAVSVGVRATDPDGGIVTLSAAGLPAGASFVDHGDNTGTFSWTPPTGAVGTYVVPVTATAANALTDTEDLRVSVTSQPGLRLTRVTPQFVPGSPNDSISLVATLENTGSGPDVFRLSAASSHLGWTLSVPPDPTLPSGGSTSVVVSTTIPAAGGASSISLRACSAAMPTLCATTTWSVTTVLRLTIEMAPTYRLGEAVTGSVLVTWLDGTPVANARVLLTQQSVGALPLGSGTETATNATGRGSFAFGGPFAWTPGEHLVEGQALKAGMGAGGAQTRYRATLT